MKRQELIGLLKSIEGKYNYLGLRGIDGIYELGQQLDTSYDWDFENDCSSYHTENPVELGGVCAINCTTHNWLNGFCTEEEDFEEVANLIIERLEYLNHKYCYNNIYLIASNKHNELDSIENDEYEIILTDAIVIAKMW